MSYRSWENAEGRALEQASVFCRYLLKGSQTFNDNTHPPLDEVETFFDNNYSIMSAQLAQFGFSPLQTDETIKDLLTTFQVYRVVLDIELSTITNTNGRPTGRQLVFQEKLKEFQKMLESGSLSNMPNIVAYPETGTTTPEWTGTSEGRKRALAGNSDNVQPDITRKMMLKPSGYHPYDV